VANMFLRFPQGRTKALTLSYDDGVEQDMRLVEIMNRHGLKGTFNLNSGLYAPEGRVHPEGQIHRRMTEKQVTETFLNSGHEIACHALTHPFLDQLPPAMVAREIIRDRENLERQFGTIVRGFAYPYGTCSDSVIETIRSCGIVYARTVESTNSFRIPTDWLRMPATCHHDSRELMTLAEKFCDGKVSREPWLFYLWGHSYEFEANNNWHVIEEFARYMGGRDDIWYATNIEIYDYIDDYNRLQFSAEGTRIKNPTARKLWFEMDGRLFDIAPGQIMEIS